MAMAESSITPILETTDKACKELIEKICNQLCGRSPPASPHNSQIYKLPDGMTKAGTGGKRTKLLSNYLHLNIHGTSKSLNLFEYSMTFEPDLENSQLQKLFLLSGQFEDVIGKNWIYKSSRPPKLFLNYQLNEKEVVLIGEHPRKPEFSYKLTLGLVERKKEDEHQQLTQFCDALFIRLFEILGLVELNMKLYDSYGAFHEPMRKLEIWPGFLVYARLYDGGLMLGFDMTIRAMKTSSCYDILQSMRRDEDDEDRMKENFTRYALGTLFMTKFDARIYKVEDIDWEQNPMSKTTFCGKEVTYVEFYKVNYGITIQHMDQPLFVVINRSCTRDSEGIRHMHMSFERIVPELCYLMRLDDARAREANGTIPPFLFRCSKLPPKKNVKIIEAYANKVKENDDCLALLKFWNVELGDFVKAEGRVLDPPTLLLGNGAQIRVSSSKPISGSLYHQIPVKKWFIFCTERDHHQVKLLLSTFVNVCVRMGIRIELETETEIIKIVPAATVPDFHCLIQDTIAKNEDTQFVMVIIPFGVHRQHFYSTLKKFLILDLKGVPSQFIRTTSILDKKRIVEMVDSLVIQINCKLGGSQRALHLPEIQESIMFIGIDTYHSRKCNSASVFAMVVSLNQTCTKYYSRAVDQFPHMETCCEILPMFSQALAAYHDENGKWPDRVIVFRDGINNKHMETVIEHELGQMRDAAQFLGPDAPKFTFIIVQKRIIERLYYVQDRDTIGNPFLGTVLDNTFTRIDYVDFLLVSQLRSLRDVPPVHYVVIANDGDCPIDTLQKLAHASCFMYFNTPGSIRIPGICQYAHRLANLIGSHLKQEPVEAATHKQLYYL